jgi:hypothetical protein
VTDPQAGWVFDVIRVPDLASRVRAGERVERMRATADMPNFFRTSCGPGWALVGDAGYHKDPCTAAGIMDAFLSAEMLADAVHDGLTGERSMDAALASYVARRDAWVRPYLELTTQLASMEPPPPRMPALLAAIAADPAESTRFFGRCRAARRSPNTWRRTMWAASWPGNRGEPKRPRWGTRRYGGTCRKESGMSKTTVGRRRLVQSAVLATASALTMLVATPASAATAPTTPTNLHVVLVNGVPNSIAWDASVSSSLFSYVLFNTNPVTGERSMLTATTKTSRTVRDLVYVDCIRVGSTLHLTIQALAQDPEHSTSGFSEQLDVTLPKTVPPRG